MTADLVDDAVDEAVEAIKRRGLPSEDVALVRLESIGPAVAQRPLASVAWADLPSQAGANARPLARYLVFMATAGVIAAFGVICETRASSAVGVAISLTTIPASAYLGVAAGVGDESKALGALAVLGVNIAMLLVVGL